MTSFSRDNPWYDFLEADPEGRRANYASFANNVGPSSKKRDYFEQQFSNVQDKYMGMMAGVARTTGADPTAGWTDFLTDYFKPGGGGDYDWMQHGPRRSGGARYNPPVQFNYGTQRPGL